jgi:hypothetical protein
MPDKQVSVPRGWGNVTGRGEKESGLSSTPASSPPLRAAQGSESEGAIRDEFSVMAIEIVGGGLRHAAYASHNEFIDVRGRRLLRQVQDRLTIVQRPPAAGPKDF